MSLLATVAQYTDLYTVTDSTESTFSPAVLLISVALAVLGIVIMWKFYKKAGRPGWASIVPFYNTWVLCEIAGRPGWWMFLQLIPIVNIVVTIIVALDIAKKFGKGGAFGFFGLWLFSIIGYAILAFGDAQYEGASAAPAESQAPAAPQAPVAGSEFQAPVQTPAEVTPAAPVTPMASVAPAVSEPTPVQPSAPSDTTPPTQPQPPVVQ
jgi:hypothetical protein